MNAVKQWLKELKDTWMEVVMGEDGKSVPDSVHLRRVRSMDSRRNQYKMLPKWEDPEEEMVVGDEVECVWNTEMGIRMGGDIRLGEVYVVSALPLRMVCQLEDVVHGDDEEYVNFNRLRFRIMKRAVTIPDAHAIVGETTAGRRAIANEQGKAAADAGIDFSLSSMDKAEAIPEPLSYALRRKNTPVYSGVIRYFPDALKAVAACSKAGNDQHNAGEPLHWAREKSGDELDALTRHLIDAGKIDSDGIRHSAKIAWRALANLQKELEENGETDY